MGFFFGVWCVCCVRLVLVCGVLVLMLGIRCLFFVIKGFCFLWMVRIVGLIIFVY